MSANIVDVDAFTSPVVVPTDGDALSAASVIQGFQPLADRTRNSKNRLDVIDAYPYADYKIDGSAVAQGSRFNLTTHVQSAGLSMAANDVTVGQTGVYEIAIAVSALNSDTSDPKSISIRLYVNGVHTREMYASRTSASPGDAVCLALRALLSLTAADVISVRSGVNDTSVSGAVLADISALTIRRVR